MSSIGTGVSLSYLEKIYRLLSFTLCNHLCFFLKYDLSASQFSPDGKVFQVEYAQKAVEISG